MTVLAQANPETSAPEPESAPQVDENLGVMQPNIPPSETVDAPGGFQAYWDLVQDVWHYGIAGIDFGDILIAAGILLVFLLFREILSRFILHRVEVITQKTENRFDDTLVTALAGPIRAIPAIMGIFFATEYLPLFGTLQDFATSLNRSLIVVVLFWGFFRVVEPMSFLLARVERVFTTAMVTWMIKAIKVIVFLIGLATVLEIWGIQVAPIIAGLGLFGVAVALGAQDLFKNLIAGILILVEKRFSIGEWIRVEGTVEGTVEAIGFRSTLIRRFDKAPVYVPNSQLSDVAVINFSRMTNRRIYWMIGVEYKTTVEQLRQIRDEIEAYVLGTGDFLPPEEGGTLFVRVDSFNASSIDIMLYAFTRTKVWGEWMIIKESLALAIKEIVEGAGSGFAFPSRTIYLDAAGDAPEAFTPPKSKRAPAKRIAAKKAAARKAAARRVARRTKAGPAGDGDA
jgi:MscS family membrane protein